ncbi:hypothetical protein XENTR_v10003480 [Xenopus tropicalis]|nr:hypothetical protein XENTR_v10003480 [Xenopus tropicalis]
MPSPFLPVIQIPPIVRPNHGWFCTISHGPQLATCASLVDNKSHGLCLAPSQFYAPPTVGSGTLAPPSYPDFYRNTIPGSLKS